MSEPRPNHKSQPQQYTPPTVSKLGHMCEGIVAKSTGRADGAAGKKPTGA
jgi:hypothetical protein